MTCLDSILLDGIFLSGLKHEKQLISCHCMKSPIPGPLCSYNWQTSSLCTQWQQGWELYTASLFLSCWRSPIQVKDCSCSLHEKCDLCEENVIPVKKMWSNRRSIFFMPLWRRMCWSQNRISLDFGPCLSSKIIRFAYLRICVLRTRWILLPPFSNSWRSVVYLSLPGRQLNPSGGSNTFP